jgi:hypothetical protein
MHFFRELNERFSFVDPMINTFTNRAATAIMSA